MALSPIPRRLRPESERNRLKLGVFGFNCSGGLAATDVAERWRPDWEKNVRLAEMADAAGIDFLLPIARWRGYAGASDYHGVAHETITWALGLLARTRAITVFGTVHAPLVHPIFAAKQMVTVDHIGRGRFGLNIVCGWNQDEFEMFGRTQREHDDRYAYGQEWWDVIQRIWSSEAPFDFEGRYLALKGVIGKPKPHGGTRPVVMNAGASRAGRGFAARNCDYLFLQIADLERARRDIEDTKAMAEGFGRSVEVITTCHVVCRPTRSAAEAYYHHYVYEHGDWEAGDHLRRLVLPMQQGRAPELQKELMYRYVAGHGTYPLIGTPDEIAAELGRLAQAGFAGTTVSFVDYLAEFPYFRDEVLPRLARAGLRATDGGRA